MSGAFTHHGNEWNWRREFSIKLGHITYTDWEEEKKQTK